MTTTILVDYAEALGQLLSNKLQDLASGERRPPVGEVTMDQIFSGTTGPRCEAGDEIMSGIASRVPRIAV